ncbi:Plasma kallikrein [Trichinella pseudospiralis]|uniref:Plasma kallikrein n=2 Tax=Trichinella pseudospiralis TaxID=6337 RepID=A0A0V1IXF9_TRIPS|nr:Plasma kallikrein [Trichinella pseudospiralis]
MSICGGTFTLSLLFIAVLRRIVTLECGKAMIPMIKTFPSYSKIIGGWEVNPNSIPWHVLVVSERANNDHLCSGTLISLKDESESSLVLTAAHCVFDQHTLQTIQKEKIYIIVGAHNIVIKEPNQVLYHVNKLAIHNQFENSSVLHDIALLKLTMPVPHNQYGLPICIPKSTDQLPIGKRCWTTGWGRSVDYEMSPRLKMVPSPLIHPRRCGIKKFESWFCICGGMLDENNIPAEGDSGGPLFCEINGVMVQHGIVSFKRKKLNNSCAYVKVKQYYPWILDTAASFDSFSIIASGKKFISSIWNAFSKLIINCCN